MWNITPAPAGRSASGLKAKRFGNDAEGFTSRRGPGRRTRSSWSRVHRYRPRPRRRRPGGCGGASAAEALRAGGRGRVLVHGPGAASCGRWRRGRRRSATSRSHGARRTRQGPRRGAGQKHVRHKRSSGRTAAGWRRSTASSGRGRRDRPAARRRPGTGAAGLASIPGVGPSPDSSPRCRNWATRRQGRRQPGGGGADGRGTGRAEATSASYMLSPLQSRPVPAAGRMRQAAMVAEATARQRAPRRPALDAAARTRRWRRRPRNGPSGLGEGSLAKAPAASLRRVRRGALSPNAGQPAALTTTDGRRSHMKYSPNRGAQT